MRKLLKPSKEQPTTMSVEAHGSIELEQILKEKIYDVVSTELNTLAKTYYRDIKVDIDVRVK